MKKSTACSGAPVLTVLAEDTPINAVNVRYNAAKEAVNNLFFQSGRRSHRGHYLAEKKKFTANVEYRQPQPM